LLKRTLAPRIARGIQWPSAMLGRGFRPGPWQFDADSEVGRRRGGFWSQRAQAGFPSGLMGAGLGAGPFQVFSTLAEAAMKAACRPDQEGNGGHGGQGGQGPGRQVFEVHDPGIVAY